MRIVTSLLFFVALLSVGVSQTISEKYDAAMDYYHSNEFSKAHDIFAEIKNTGGKKEILDAAYYFSAECRAELEQPDAAASEFEYFIVEFPNSNFRHVAIYKLGLIYLNLNKPNTARKRFTQLTTEYSESEYSGSALHWIGESYSKEEKFIEAESALKEAVAVKSNNFKPRSYFYLASNYEKQGKYEMAAPYYDTLRAYYRKDEIAPEAQFRLGVCYFNLKQYDAVILELTDPLLQKLNADKQTEAEYLLANSFFRLKDYDNAYDTYSRLLKATNDRMRKREIQYGLAWLKFQEREYEASFRLFKELADNGSDRIAANALYWSGECKRYSEDFDTALLIYNSFLSKYPNDPLSANVRFNIGVIYYNRGDKSEAEQYLILTVDSDDKNSKAKSLKLLGEMSLARKDILSAKKYYEEALSLEPLPSNIKNQLQLGLAVAEYYLDNFDKTVSILNKLSSSNPRFENDKVNFYLAESHFMLKNYSPALKHFSRVNIQNPEIGAEALYGRAYSFFNLKDYPNSSFYFGEFASLFPQNQYFADAKMREADSYYGVKNYSKSAEIYSGLINSGKGSYIDDRGYYQYGQALFKSDKSEEAIRIFSLLQDKFPRSKYSDDAQYLIGWINFQNGSFEKSIGEYRKVLTKYSSSTVVPIALYSIGDAYYNLSSYDSSIAYYSRILNEFPNSKYVFDAVNGIQFCYLAQGKDREAIKFIDQYLSEGSNSDFADQIFFKKGEIYFSSGDYTRAINEYNIFIEKFPQSKFVPNAYYWIGKAYYILEDREAAEVNFRTVIQKYIDDEVGISSVLELGKIYAEDKLYDVEIELYENAISRLPDNEKIPELIFAKGKAYAEKGDLQNAYETFNYIITYYVSSVFTAKAKLELGIMEYERGSYETAQQLFKELGDGRFDEIGAKAQYYLGLSLKDEGKITEAVTAFVRVRSIFGGYDEWYTRSLLKLGDCYLEMRERGQAREMYRAVAKRHPNDEFGEEAKRKLRGL